MSELNDLLRQKETLASQLSRIDESGVDKILNAIKRQRWFFFKNKPKVLFDRDTALLWANLKYFPYGKNDNNDYYSPDEILRLMESTNSRGIDSFKNWRVPTNFKLWTMIADGTFPFQSGINRRIQDRDFWCVTYKGNFRRKDLDISGATNGILNRGNCFVIPCSSAVAPKDYEQNVSPANKVYSDKEKILMTLNVFTTNGLEPIFSDATITELFRQIYIVKPEVQRQLTEIQQQIERLNEVELLSPKLDWLALKTKFDLGADKSPVRYAASLKNFTEHLLAKFDEYTADKADALTELQRLSPPNELVPDVKLVRKELDSFRDDALSLEDALIRTASLRRLAELHDQVRPPFEVVVETLTEKVRGVLLKVEFFELQADFVREACAAFELKFDFRAEFLKQLHLADRAAKNFLVELVRYVKAGHLQTKIGDNTAARIALAQLQNYREAVANLFRTSPNDPHKSEILTQAEVLQNNFAEVIGALDDESERRRLSNLIRQLQAELNDLP